MESNYNKVESIDSCIIMRIIKGDIPNQKKRAIELLLNGKDYYVDDVAIMEVVHVLKKLRTPRNVIVESLRTFLSNPMIIYDELFFARVFEKYATHPSLSFDDCVLEAKIAMKRKEPLWTFDQKFARQSDVARLLTY